MAFNPNALRGIYRLAVPAAVGAKVSFTSALLARSLLQRTFSFIRLRILCPSCIQQDVRSRAPTRNIRHIRVTCQRIRNIPTRLDLSNLNQPVSALGNRLCNGIRTLGLALGANNVGLTLLLGFLDDESRPLGILLRNLLLLDGLGELLAERHVRDGDVLEGNVELGGALHEVGSDAIRDGLALGDELGGIELRDDGFEDFVADGGKDALVIVLAE